jgi:ATP-dependent RNA helicase DDX24/MAK5
LQERSENPSEKKGVRALIFTPTRELALQITDHIKSVCSLVKIATLVGGMSTQKQERLLNARPEIVIATPGRFWDWVQMVCNFCNNFAHFFLE